MAQNGNPYPDIVIAMPDLSGRTFGILENLDYIESLPIDGIVVNIPASYALMSPGYEVTEADLSHWLDPLDGVFETLDANYIQVNIDDPGDLFNDDAWAQVVENMARLAEAAEAVGFKGIYFDNEEYFGEWLNFPEDYPAGDRARGLAAYQDQAVLRGQQMAAAIAEVWPDAHLFSLHGPYLSLDPEPGDPEAIELQAGSGALDLLGPLFTGMAEGAGPDMTVIDGGELYALRSDEDFAESEAFRNDRVAERIDWSLDPGLRDSWAEEIETGHMVYTGEFPNGFDQTPASFEESLVNAARHSEGLVVVYSEEGLVEFLTEGATPRTWLRALESAVARIDATPVVGGRLVTIDGTGARDITRGTGGSDGIRGLAGRDSLKGDAGSDTISGGNGADLVAGQAGDDVLLGGGGADRLRGASGEDRLRGGPGRDDLRGGSGADRLDGDGGADTLTGGGGADTFVLSAGADIVLDFELGLDNVLADPAATIVDSRSGLRVEGAEGSLLLTGVFGVGLDEIL